MQSLDMDERSGTEEDTVVNTEQINKSPTVKTLIYTEKTARLESNNTGTIICIC